ncbi:hypothetical protein JTB14_018581 [Gonioctena quinquepunctata]|nr:hypothetical protein JTB14_018581 [Gonioctena quinquepunctata]
MFLTGEMASSRFGWSMAFYFFGALGLCWCILFSYYGCNAPKYHSTITIEEKHYLKTSMNHADSQEMRKTPWKDILSSVPYWVVFFMNCINIWVFWIIQAEIPIYMSKVLKFDIESSAACKNINFIFVCCKKKTLNGYYVCTKCSGVSHTSCSLQTKSFTHSNDHNINCENCNISNETKIDVYPEDEEIADLKREVQSRCDNITKMRLEYTLFYDEAIEMENNFLKEQEHLQNNICQFEVVIKTLRDRGIIESRRAVFIDANTQTSASAKQLRVWKQLNKE